MTLEELRAAAESMQSHNHSADTAEGHIARAITPLIDMAESGAVLICMQGREAGEWGDKWRNAMLSLAALPGKETARVDDPR
jgi:hypothetical protein